MEVTTSIRPTFFWISRVGRFFGICLLMILNVPVFLSAGIVLQVSPTEGYIDVRIVEPRTSVLLVTDVCDVYVIAKHRSKGCMYVTYSALSDGIRTVEYPLFDERNQVLLQNRCFAYYLDGVATQEVSLGRIRARIPSNTQGMQSSLTFHLVLEL